MGEAGGRGDLTSGHGWAPVLGDAHPHEGRIQFISSSLVWIWGGRRIGRSPRGQPASSSLRVTSPYHACARVLLRAWSPVPGSSSRL
ncbi:hypothetical protein U9M48_032883 [Paspalum notatum var. saurae]|uniref:Uncharacterized protein n=1 Tax=Paspalum notatum var. saurae TaxID=547442 RepID=A0AAQ3U678_PASNO